MSSDAFAFSAPPSPEELARFELNDTGNAMRLIRLSGGRVEDDGSIDLACSEVLYLRRRGWIVFNGRYFDLDRGEGLARRRAAKVAHGLYAQMQVREAELVGDGAKASSRAITSLYDFAVQAGNSGRIAAMLAVAQAYLEVEGDAFDADPMALNCANGVVRLRRDGEGRPEARFTAGHQASDRFTRIVDAPYEPGAPAALFRGVVDFALPVVEDRHYVHKVAGYWSTGSTKEQKFFVFQGKGGDGKSTIVNAVRDTLGSYATVAAIETFLDTGPKRGADASPDIAALAGDTRMISAGEPPAGSKLATGGIKAFTGGGKLKARELREGLFEFSPIGKPVIECNRRPAINDTDDGIWRRIKIVMFKRQVPASQIDGDLPTKLRGERPGILAWIIEGALAWMAEGLADPESVRAAVEDYRRGANPFAQWLADRVILDASARIGASVLYNDYKRWMEDNGHDKPMSQKAFGGALGDLQIILGPKDGSGKVTRTGARLRDAEVFGGRAEPSPFDPDPAPYPVSGAGGPLSSQSGPDDPHDAPYPDDWGGE